MVPVSLKVVSESGWLTVPEEALKSPKVRVSR